MKIKKTLNLVFALITLASGAQNTANEVINAAGEDRKLGTNIIITDNVGESFTQSLGLGNFLITQGFLQPDVVSPGGFTVTLFSQDLKCLDKESDAFISIDIATPVKSYTASYFWSPASACPTNDCKRLDSLNPGSYAVGVRILYRNNVGALLKDSVVKYATILNATEPCKVTIYNGVTPNKDGVNDVWTIEDITEYPKNNVTIFNRWGVEVFSATGYNNRDKSWPDNSAVEKLPASTYFYILNLGDGSKPIKGWLELIKN